MSKVKRTRTGCLCCRRRHKKCDEAKPSCKFCESKGITCEWPVMGAVFVNYGHSNAEQGTLVFDSALSTAPSASLPQPPAPAPSTGPVMGTMISSFYTTDYQPSSKASSTASEESLERSPKTPKSTLELFPPVVEEPQQRYRTRSFSSFSFPAPPSPKSEINFSLATTTATPLPPLKAYHFLQRVDNNSSCTPLTIAPKRLSVDSLLN